MERAMFLMVGAVLLAGPLAALWLWDLGPQGFLSMVFLMLFGAGAMAGGLRSHSAADTPPATPFGPGYDGTLRSSSDSQPNSGGDFG